MFEIIKHGIGFLFKNLLLLLLSLLFILFYTILCYRNADAAKDPTLLEKKSVFFVRFTLQNRYTDGPNTAYIIECIWHGHSSVYIVK